MTLPFMWRSRHRQVEAENLALRAAITEANQQLRKFRLIVATLSRENAWLKAKPDAVCDGRCDYVRLGDASACICGLAAWYATKPIGLPRDQGT